MVGTVRRLLILGAVLVVLAGAVWLAAANANRYLESHRDWLAEQASTALGRPVAFDAIGVSFRRGLGVRVSDVVIGEDSAFGKEAFLRATRVDAALKILPGAARPLRAGAHRDRRAPDQPHQDEGRLQLRLARAREGRGAPQGRGGAFSEPSAAASRLLPAHSRWPRAVRRRHHLPGLDPARRPDQRLGLRHRTRSPGVSRDAAAVLDAAGQNVRIAGSVGPATEPRGARERARRASDRPRPVGRRSPQAVRADRQVDPGRSLVSGSGFARRAALRNALLRWQPTCRWTSATPPSPTAIASTSPKACV